MGAFPNMNSFLEASSFWLVILFIPAGILIFWSFLIYLIYRQTSIKSELFSFLHFGRGFWNKYFFQQVTIGVMLSFAIPSVVLLAKTLSPVVIEITNLAAVYLVTLVASAHLFTRKQYGAQFLCIFLLMCAAAAFILSVEFSNNPEHFSLHSLVDMMTFDLLWAVLLGFIAQGALWFFLRASSTPVTEANFFGYLSRQLVDKRGRLRVQAWGFFGVWVGCFLWLIFGGGAGYGPELGPCRSRCLRGG